MDLLSIPNDNPSLPPKIKEGREMFKYAAIFFLVAALIYFLWGFFSIMSGVLWSIIFLDASYSLWSMFNGIIRIVFAVVALILKGKLVDDLIKPIDQGKVGQIDDTTMIVYMILGFIFGLVISGLLVLLGYMKLDEANTQTNVCPTCQASLRYVPQYDNWYCDNCGDYKTPVSPPQPSGPPPEQQQQEQQQPPSPPSDSPPPPED
ncbi:MAG: hypothetical protein ACOCTR_00165 [Candidatus Natronoplasma sp.]